MTNICTMRKAALKMKPKLHELCKSNQAHASFDFFFFLKFLIIPKYSFFLLLRKEYLPEEEASSPFKWKVIESIVKSLFHLIHSLGDGYLKF